MSLEREIKEAFERHANDATPAPDAWDATETKIVHARRARGIAVSVIALAAVIAVAVLVPRLGHNSNAQFAGPDGSPTSEPTSQKVPPTAFANLSYGYTIFFDHPWEQSNFEGHDEFRAPGLPSVETGEPTFWVDVTLESGTTAAAIPNPDGYEMIADRKTPYEESTTNGHSIHFAIDWTGRGGCPGGAPTCSSNFSGGPKVLHVRVTATSSELWPQYSAEGLKAARTLKATQDSAQASPEPTNAARQVMLKFLAARSSGRNAEGFLSAEAKRSYDTHEGGLGLYQETSTGVGKPYRGSEIDDQVAADANSWEFTVTLQFEAGAVTERIGVGPGITSDGNHSPYVIRFAMVVPDQRPRPTENPS